MKEKFYSPELSVYQSQVTSLYSVFNRITSVILSGFWLVLFLAIKVFKISILGYFFYYFSYYVLFSFNFFVNLVITFVLFAFLFHLFVGIRHLLWDSGRLLKLDEVGYTSLVIVVLTIITEFLSLLEL